MAPGVHCRSIVHCEMSSYKPSLQTQSKSNDFQLRRIPHVVLDRKSISTAYAPVLHRSKPVAASQQAAAASAGFMKQMSWMYKFVLGWCHHDQMSRVFTLKKRTYQVCFECGREFDYSWARMHIQRSADRACVPLHIARPVQLPGILVAHAISLNS
jgi:hypothetical protein